MSQIPPFDPPLQLDDLITGAIEYQRCAKAGAIDVDAFRVGVEATLEHRQQRVLERVRAETAEEDRRYAQEKAAIQSRHEGDPAYETHESPRRLRMREEYERLEEQMGR